MPTLRELLKHPLDKIVMGSVRRIGGKINPEPFTDEEIESLLAVWKTYDPSWQVEARKGSIWVDTPHGTTLQIQKDRITFHGSIHDSALTTAIQEAKEAWGGKVDITGSADFKLRYWAHAQVAGVQVMNYTPSADQMKEAQALISQIHSNNFLRTKSDNESPVASLMKHAQLLRKEREREIARSGESFWDSNDIDGWARNVQRLEKSRGYDEIDRLWTSLPAGSIHPLREHVSKLKSEEREAQRAFATDLADAENVRKLFNKDFTFSGFDHLRAQLRQQDEVLNLMDSARKKLVKDGVEIHVSSQDLAESAFDAYVKRDKAPLAVEQIANVAVAKAKARNQTTGPNPPGWKPEGSKPSGAMPA